MIAKYLFSQVYSKNEYSNFNSVSFQTKTKVFYKMDE